MIATLLPDLLTSLQAPPKSTTPLFVVGGYLALLLLFSIMNSRRARTSASEYFVAGRSIGPFLLLMSVFGTTMTAFALVGSTGKSFDSGIGVYGLMASASGIIHSLVFFLVGIRLWAIGKRFNFVTQIQFFRARFDSNRLGYLLFPVLVGLVIPYLLIGIVGAGAVAKGISGVPTWLTGMVVCSVVLAYILIGGVRAAAMANAVQTIVFMVVGILAFYLISDSLGGVQAATQAVADHHKPEVQELLARENKIGHLQFLTYCLVPLSVGMFPHLFQHWLTARSAKTFRLTVIAHPLFIMIVWAPCVLIGIWAAGADIEAPGGNSNAILAKMVGMLLKNPWVSGLLMAGILAAIMSSLDSQFVCLGSIFTHDIVVHAAPGRFSDAQRLRLGRIFIVAIVLLTYLLSLFDQPNVFNLAVWCFSGFASLFPLVVAAVYWRRATAAGAIASIVVAGVTWVVLFYDGLLASTPVIGELVNGDYLICGMMPVAIMLAASTIALVGVSLATRPPEARIVDRFFVDPHAC